MNSTRRISHGSRLLITALSLGLPLFVHASARADDVDQALLAALRRVGTGVDMGWCRTVSQRDNDINPTYAIMVCARGAVYWKPATGAHALHESIFQKFQSFWASGGQFLGYPVTDIMTTPGGAGQYAHFEGGSIYYTPETGAHVIYGQIRQRWAELGWEQNWLGYPTTDELPAPDGIGRYSMFEGGAIYWNPDMGAHEKYGVVDMQSLALKGPYTGLNGLNNAANAAMNMAVQLLLEKGVEYSIGIIRYNDGSYGLTAPQRGTKDAQGHYHADFNTRDANIPADAKLVGTSHGHPDDAGEPNESPSTLPMWIMDTNGNRWYIDPKTHKVHKLPNKPGAKPSQGMPGHAPLPSMNRGVPMWAPSIPEGMTADTIVQVSLEGWAELDTGDGIIKVSETGGSSGSSSGLSGFLGLIQKFW
jgi:hypothetical protein